ncbi:SRPBCC domain-containing protein [Cytophagaceae bacterium YF14B1]|uniref:SRPBCC domain-containing protein n=1 Tax=Xanthocytophaga flava TaxID=3048013 RepID=A0AAE3QUA0_9BACT|nr:SRPBCC domain-containing protein [Xanthocytophaga flavus]MDJ1483355.1 SRPBCC domain-containing protein [Xanthocytophaga flavus]
MTQATTVQKSILINAPTAKVWHAITDPAMIKQLFFGTTVESEWKVGGPIVYHGEWEGNSYIDKGTILQLEPEKRFQHTYWSSVSGTTDAPENYATITYEITQEGNQSRLAITQDNVISEKTGDGWQQLLENMKKILETNS